MDGSHSALDLISAHAFDAEAPAVEHLLELAAPFAPLDPKIRARARKMVERLRADGLGLSVEAFLQEYGLSTREGIAVMCLAEALLRIPDPATAEALIESNLKGLDFARHLGQSDSLFVNASSWGLLLTGRVLEIADDERKGMLSGLMRKAGEPAIRASLKAAMRLIASQFVLGETIEDAIGKSKPYAKEGYRFSFDMLGEGARSALQAERYLASYHAAIAAVGKKGRSAKPGDSLFAADSLSIKLTALHPRYEWRHKERVFAELLPKLKGLVLAARDAGIAVAIDAEEATRLDLELDLFARLFLDPDFAGYEGIGFVLQAYQKRAIHIVPFLADLSRRAGRRMPIRLVKGAYWDSEIKAAQIAGLPDYPVFTRKAHSDLSYLACARLILDAPECFYPQFATHNAMTISAIAAYAGDAPYEFQRLHGMGEALYKEIVPETPCRIYAPVGEHRDLLAYLIRRLLENGANSSFVRLMLDAKRPVESVLEDPLAASRAEPGEGVALPVRLYAPGRRNSGGLDLGNRVHTAALAAALELTAEPLPADHTPSEVISAIATAEAAQPAWDRLGAQARAEILRKAADLLAERQPQAMSHIIREGRRIWGDALFEAREAEDFLRYYAQGAEALMTYPAILPGPTGERNELHLAGRGVWAAISPWNFPLSIFLGQVVAALATGNAVVAKPAEQTPGVARWAAELLYEAGLPRDVLQLVYGPGETIGAALVKDRRIAGVVFTGGFPTAKHIQRSLAERDGPIIPFIAETGGQNALIVDSSALPEQAVDDIVNSAFGSAGQRCSSLRVLFVQEEIAEDVIALIAGAMQELRIDDPAEFATDIGPLIDDGAAGGIRQHLGWLKSNGTKRGAVPLPPGLGAHYVAPALWEIPSIHLLKQEVFGPVLHVVRFKSSEIARVIDDIHATGYGLTFGLHSRIPDVITGVSARMQVGNCYINRGITGAVVGTQPFGGEGLSGTGPKAGGPFYLSRFVSERSLSINTAAIGGNVELLIG